MFQLSCEFFERLIMKICLKKHAKQMGSRTVQLFIEERKPAYISSPCKVSCEFQVEACQDYYLLTLNVSGAFEITCQRCMEDFQQTYDNQTTLAVCAREDIAETLMTTYECIVAADSQVDIMDIVTDELHLFLPEKHPDPAGCDHEISGFIGDII